MATRKGWQSTKIGAGPVPIETPEGWLLIYHGVLTLCNGFVYSYGLALLDQPIGRLAFYYGGAEMVTAQAFEHLDEKIDFVKSESELYIIIDVD